MLADHLLEILEDWRPAFSQHRVHLRAIRQALGSLTAVGRRTLTRVLWALGLQGVDWTAEYRLHQRSSWSTRDLFFPILRRALEWCSEEFVTVAFDDTCCRKTGRKVAHVSWQKDPCSPPFRANLLYGLRFLQASLVVPLYRRFSLPPRALPIGFEEVPAVKKPPRKAPAKKWEEYRAQKKVQNLSTAFVHMLTRCREDLDRAGAAARRLVAVVDGSFCNRTVFTASVQRVVLIARARKDCKLCKRAPKGSRRFYGEHKFTPQEVRSDVSTPWVTARIFHGGKWRSVRFKEVPRVMWQRGAQRRPLRLLVVAPIPYRTTPTGKTYYRHPAYLLTTDIDSPAETLLQCYFDRWQIEVNFREEKDTIGVGQAQVRVLASVQRQPAFVVAAYSALHLAGLVAFGPQRSPEHFLPLPKWRRNAIRPSCLDLISILRRELADKPHILEHLGARTSTRQALLAANA
jgi:hypothetical protein